MRRRHLTVEEWAQWLGVNRATVYRRVGTDRAGVSHRKRNGKKKLVVSSDRIRVEFPGRFRDASGKGKISETMSKLDRLTLEVRQLREVVVEFAAAALAAGKR